MTEIPAPPPLAAHWDLDPTVVQLNHGSFGATPRVVLERQRELRDSLEADPTGFYLRVVPALLERARIELGRFVGAKPDDIALITNATTGVNAVLRSFGLAAGDEVVYTDHEYPACRNAVSEIATAFGATAKAASLPFPLASPGEVVDAVVSRFSKQSRLLLIDHVTSPSGLVLPLAEIAKAARDHGVAVLVDGAHAPGMIEVEIESLGVEFYTGNCHKWICAPKGAGFLWVRRDWRERIRPVVVSHGATATDDRFRHEFDWTGTDDPTARLCVPDAIAAMAGMLDRGWFDVRRRNRELALAARDLLCGALGVDPPAPDAMIGSMAAVPLPPGEIAPVPPFAFDPFQDVLWERHRIEVPVITWLPGPGRVLRISAQLYNRLEHYRYLADALHELL